ncbi:MAG: glycosyltransferase [Gemmatimonadaceae bacterium]|nr:glycosyltransferase [Gemmatimonadaceae bacterium]
MRVLTVIDDLGSGGAQRQIVNLAVGLAARGHDVRMFTYHPDGHFRPALEAAGIPVELARKPSRFSPAPILALRRAIRTHRADAVVAFLETPAVYAELAAVGQGTTLLVGERNSVPGGAVSMGRAVKSQLHRMADLVVANSHAHRDWMATRFPYLADRLHAVWNGIDLDRFVATPVPPVDGPVRLLGVGRVAPAKNVPRLIAALARARAAGHDVVVDWAGRVDDPAEQARCEAALRATPLGEAWRWLGERSDVPELLAAHHGVIAPSLWEGLPNAVCEALACGRPVLASRVADNARLVEPDVRGDLFPADDVESIAGAIGRFAALDDASRAARGRAARVFAEAHLGQAACTAAYEALLQRAEARA